MNTVIGLALTAVELPPSLTARLSSIQNDLFDLGADLCVPEQENPPDPAPLRVTAKQVTQLENWIDEATDSLKPLESFILPGGSPAAAHLHHARAVCRRVEIGVYRLTETETVNEQVTMYLNRLSDLLFVWARSCNDEGRSDVLWIPGGKRAEG